MSQYESQFEENLYQLRREKLQQIADIARAADPSLLEAAAKFPNSFAFTHTVPELRAAYADTSAEGLEAVPVEAAIAGRIMAIRVQGKAGFAHVQQGGERLQIYVRKDDVGEAMFALYKLLDLGDHVGVRGHLMRTRTGELTLKASAVTLAGHEGAPALTLLTKSMLALPDKYHGLEDVELRYRQRYVDLIVNSGTREAVGVVAPGAPVAEIAGVLRSAQDDGAQQKVAGASAVPGATAVTDPAPDDAQHEDAPLNVREVFVKRAAVLRAIRKFFDARGYLEVETPMLHTVAGGAAARPFTTHHNALDIPLSLRIAPELYLKRLVVGGLDRVYEINRNFRNEGVSTRHNPEFTMLEFYQAYANYHDLMDLTQELITQVAMDVNGTMVTHFAGEDIDLSNWQRLSMREAIARWAPGVALPAGGKEIAELFERCAEEHLIQPTIIYDFPLAVSPLSKVKPDEPEWVERFEFYIGGFEVGNAFSELNDADDQRARFVAQVADKDPESMGAVDEDYVRALGYGLPPTAGEGIGIDRLTMLLTGSRSIRDVILFPLMRPVAKAAEDHPLA